MNEPCAVKELGVVKSLRSREYGSKCCYRRNLKIIRTLACRSNFIYKKVWEKQSNKSIYCEGARVYFNNFQECYSGYTKGLGPKKSYQLPETFLYEKIEDALVCQIPMDPGEDLRKCNYVNSLYGITHDNKLVRFHLQSGRVLQVIPLPNKYSFRKLSWDTEGYTLMVKSIHLTYHHNVKQVLAVYDVCPLRFQAMMEIPKSIFGPHVKDVALSQGLLITMHSKGLVKMYSFSDILQKHRINPKSGETAIDNDVNIYLKEEPPVLFELKCADHLIEIGGSPWHYLYSRPNQEGVFRLTHLETHQQARNGVLDLECYDGIDPHRAIFHPDESGRVIHIGDTVLQVHKISCSSDGCPYVEECFTIEVTRTEPSSLLAFPAVTRSGRRVKRRAQAGYTDTYTMNIEDVDYENELNVLCVTSVQQGEGLMRTKAITGFYDNWTGKLLKETVLEQPWESFYEQRVVVDLDTVVQTVKPRLGMFRCIVYRLVREDSETEDSDT